MGPSLVSPHLFWKSFGATKRDNEAEEASNAPTIDDSMQLSDFTNGRFAIDKEQIDWKNFRFLDEGSVSFVYRATLDNQHVAVKVLRTDSEHEEDEGSVLSHKCRDFLTELGAVSNLLPHPNITAFIGAGMTEHAGKTVPMIVYEYVGGGSAEQLFKRRSRELGQVWKPPSNLSLRWCQQLFTALDFLHTAETPMAHRDIKLANVLISEDLSTLKLADFSLATPITARESRETDWESLPSIAGSLRYMAPEASESGVCHFDKADIYSAAMTTWALCNGSKPFSVVSDANTVLHLVKRHMRPPVREKKLAKILEEAWHPDPLRRPSAAVLARQLEGLLPTQGKQSVFRKMLSKVMPSKERVLRCHSV